MNLKPGPGYIFLKMLDKMPDKIKGTGFGAETQKLSAEEPYKFKVVAVGGPRPFEGRVWPSPVEEGDTIFLNNHNKSLRESYPESWFLHEDEMYLAADFSAVMGIAQPNMIPQYIPSWEGKDDSDIPF